MYIYLDDKRDPEMSYPETTREWVVVRNMADFIQLWVDNRDSLKGISLDHDLDEGQPTGFDVAKWIVYEQCIEHGFDLSALEIRVHSANPVGAENIWGIFRSYLKFSQGSDLA